MIQKRETEMLHVTHNQKSRSIDMNYNQKKKGEKDAEREIIIKTFKPITRAR